MRKVWRWAAIALLVCIFVADVYRAVTQSLTIDEAYTYNLYLSKPVHELLTNYDANNHVLYNVLAKLSMWIFGDSEWAIRLPSVIGGLLYLIAVYRISLLVAGETWLLLLSCALLSLNPYLLDFLSAARGYGLSLGLFLWALYLLARSRSATVHRYDVRRSGFLLGLAIASNLTMLFPVAAVACAYWLLHRSWRTIDELGMPMCVAAAIFLIVPLSHAIRDKFYVGAETWKGTMESIVGSSFWHHETSWAALQRAAASNAMAVLLAALLVCAGALWWRKYEHQFLLATLALTVAAIFASHWIAGLKYPVLRTGLYLIPLASICIISAIASVPQRAAQVVLTIPLILCCVVYAAEWNTRIYAEWPFDEHTRELAGVLRDHHPRKAGASWLLVESLNYYRDRYKLPTEPLTRATPDADYDLYFLLPDDYAVITKRHLREISRDPRTQVVVALPPS